MSEREMYKRARTRLLTVLSIENLTLSEAYKLSDNDLLRLPNFGRKCLKVLRHIQFKPRQLAK